MDPGTKSEGEGVRFFCLASFPAVAHGADGAAAAAPARLGSFH